MKLFTLALLFIVTIAVAPKASAQWSNTTNLFYDSLHMPVCNAVKAQVYSLTVRSYPDSGYFVIWQDYRNDPKGANAIGLIYAQKYDKAGTMLWGAGGIPVATSPNNQHFSYQNASYRRHSYAATDSAGGFYITYADDSVTNYVYQRVCLQHIKSSGNPVFAGPGYIIASSTTANQTMAPQLIADGAGGCFVSFQMTTTDLHVYCYKDVNGTIQNMGGGIMNQNAIQLTATSPCGNYTYLSYMDATVLDYSIFSDLQGGCNVVMSINVNSQGNMLAYNKLFRAKQTCTATQYVRNTDYTPYAQPTTYTKGNVYRLYYLITDNQQISCGSSSNVYTVTQYRLVQNGFLELDGGNDVYDLSFPKGVTVSTSGNINASLMIGCIRSYSSATGVSSAIIKGYSVKEEIFDSIPYQRASDTDPDYPGYNQVEPAGTAKLNWFRDTLLAGNGNGDFEASLAGGANQIFTGGLLPENNLSNGYRNLRLQRLAVESAGPDSFAVVYKTDVKNGVIIGQDEQNYFYGGQYDLPMFEVNKNGNALFYIKESDGSTGPARVSPIFNGVQLAWGAMGREIGSAIAGGYYNMSTPTVSLDPTGGTALISWTDTRNAATSGPADIYMRHLDNLNDPNYQPPYERVRPMPDPYGPVTTSAILYGTSNSMTTIEANSTLGPDPGVAPAVAISDNYNLGNVSVKVYENTGGIRNNNGAYYLDRSFVITPDNNPNGAATINIRLFFTTDEFNALKAADPSISSPGDLGVIKQPSGTGSGGTYTVVAGEKMITPISWAAVAGGYYIEIQVTSFSNFFIFKNTNPLPLNWLGIQAQWQNTAQANVSWQVAEQANVLSYTVQHSTDGNVFTDACTVTADAAKDQYNCIVEAGYGKNYYRVVETDNDGKINYSKTVLLESALQGLSIYPNPARDVLYIEGVGNYKICSIADVDGHIVQRQVIISPKQMVNISGLAPGLYILTLTGDGDSKTIRFIKH